MLTVVRDGRHRLPRRRRRVRGDPARGRRRGRRAARRPDRARDRGPPDRQRRDAAALGRRRGASRKRRARTTSSSAPTTRSTGRRSSARPGPSRSTARERQPRLRNGSQSVRSTVAGCGGWSCWQVRRDERLVLAAARARARTPRPSAARRSAARIGRRGLRERERAERRDLAQRRSPSRRRSTVAPAGREAEEAARRLPAERDPGARVPEPALGADARTRRAFVGAYVSYHCRELRAGRPADAAATPRPRGGAARRRGSSGRASASPCARASAARYAARLPPKWSRITPRSALADRSRRRPAAHRRARRAGARPSRRDRGRRSAG